MQSGVPMPSWQADGNWRGSVIDGKQRPLGIAAIEDKTVQAAVVAILTPIYEAEFLGFGYGFRSGRSQHDALDALAYGIKARKINWIRLGALLAEAYDCFMVWTPYGFNRIQAWFARLIAANGRLPSDHRAANHPIAGSLPPCSRPSRTSLRRR
jgi:hypothetical protein